MTQIGVQWNFTRAHPHSFGKEPGLYRLGAAEDPAVLATTATPAEIAAFFDTISPWKYMIRETKNTDVMVKVPKFYYHVDTTGYAAGIIRWWVSDTLDDTITNFDQTTSVVVLHPAFKTGATTYNEFYIGAYEGYILTSQLRSLSGVQPSTNYTPAQLHAASTVRGAGYSLTTYQALCAIQLLITIEFASIFPAWYLGEGIVYLKASTSANRACNTGHTTGASGSTEFSPDYPSCPAYPSELGKTRAVCYRGIENIWGNTTELIDGALLYTKQLYTKEDNLTVGYYDGVPTGTPPVSYSATGVMPSARYLNVGKVSTSTTDYALTEAGVAGADHIHTTTTGNVTAGDILYIYSTSFGGNVGETRTVYSVTGSASPYTITFTAPLTRSWAWTAASPNATSFILYPQYYYQYPTMVDVGVGHTTTNWTFMPIKQTENPPQQMAYAGQNYFVGAQYTPSAVTQDYIWLLKHGSSYNSSHIGGAYALEWAAPNTQVGYTTSGRLFYRGA